MTLLCVDRFKRPVMVPLNTQARFKILDREPKRSPQGRKQPIEMDLQDMNLTSLVTNYKMPLFVRILDDDVDQEIGSKRYIW
jgi:hypothetical protein